MLGTLLASFATIETAQVAARIRRAAVAYGLAAIFMLAGVGFLLGAAFIAIAARYGHLATALGFGLGFLVVGALIVGIHRLSSRLREKRRADRRSVEVKTLAGAAAVALLPVILRRGVGLATLLVPVAAVAALLIARENMGARPDGDYDDD